MHQDLFSGWSHLPIDRWHYSLQGRRHKFRSSDVQTIDLLSELFSYYCAKPNHNWAVFCRAQIRTLQELNSRNILTLVVEHAEQPVYRILAIWLRGRCGGYSGTEIVARFANDSDDQTRKEVARALKRMSAWTYLREISEQDESERVRRIASTAPTNTFNERLANFTSHTVQREVSAAPCTMFVSSELELQQGKRPKSLSFIRTILERIRRLVATKVTN